MTITAPHQNIDVRVKCVGFIYDRWHTLSHTHTHPNTYISYTYKQVYIYIRAVSGIWILTSPGRSLVIIHLSKSSLLARFSCKNLAEKVLASSRMFSPGNISCEALYRLYIPVTAWFDCPAKQKNSPPFSKCLNTSVRNI